MPFLTMFRALLALRVARPARVAGAALRGSRSARATLTGRVGWLGALTAIVVFSAADVIHSGAYLLEHRQASVVEAAAAGLDTHAGAAVLNRPLDEEVRT